MYRLHCFCQSGSCYKVALTLRCLNQPWTPVFVNYMNGATRREDWRRMFNEMGEVPMLEDGSLRLTQSAVILLYLARKHRQFHATDEIQELEILRWLFFDNHKFTSYFATYRFMKAFGESRPDPGVLAWLRNRIDQVFAIADGHLASRNFVVGATPTIADFSMCGYLFFPEEESGLEFSARYPNLAKWLDRIRALPGWADPYKLLPGDRIAPRW